MFRIEALVAKKLISKSFQMFGLDATLFVFSTDMIISGAFRKESPITESTTIGFYLQMV